MRRLLPPFALLAALVVCLLPGAAAGGSPASTPTRHVDVLEVNGLIDPIVADLITTAVRNAERQHAEALVVQLDSGGGVLRQSRADALAFRLAHAGVPVAVWVGPSGGRAVGTAFDLLRAAAIRGAAPGTRLGKAPARIFGGPNPLARRTVTAEVARQEGVVQLVSPTLGDFIVGLDGLDAGGTTLHTAEIVRNGTAGPRRQPTVQVRFAKLGLLPRLLHTAASPSAAYFLLVVGLALIVFELYTAGVGVAGVVGAGAVILAAYGLTTLPTRPLSVALIALAIFGYAVDVQSGTPRVWTVIGTVLLAVASVRLYRGMEPSLFVMALVVVGVALFMVAGMPAMVRARFSTPTIGRESMIGELGAAVVAVAPEGTVTVQGAPWRARTNRATPIAAGDRVRVVGIDGLLLEVEPIEGAASDHRR